MHDHDVRKSRTEHEIRDIDDVCHDFGVILAAIFSAERQSESIQDRVALLKQCRSWVTSGKEYSEKSNGVDWFHAIVSPFLRNVFCSEEVECEAMYTHDMMEVWFEHYLTRCDSGNVDKKTTCDGGWGQFWAVGVALAKHVCSRDGRVTKRALELARQRNIRPLLDVYEENGRHWVQDPEDDDFFEDSEQLERKE
jgi:hypothetical protein